MLCANEMTAPGEGSEVSAFTIGKLAKEAGVNVETIRYYERLGLLADPPRTAAGYRQYTSDAVERIHFIKRAQRLGFTLEEIDELLESQFENLLDCSDISGRALAKAREIDEMMAELEERKRSLLRLVQECETDCEDTCTVLLDTSAGCSE